MPIINRGPWINIAGGGGGGSLLSQGLLLLSWRFGGLLSGSGDACNQTILFLLVFRQTVLNLIVAVDSDQFIYTLTSSCADTLSSYFSTL